MPPSIAPAADATAGILAGTVSTIILSPVDLLTVRMQVSEGKMKGFFPAARELARTDGVRALWNGLSPNVISAASAWGLYFGLYNKAKATLSGGGANDRLSATVTLNPIWVVKARLFTQQGGIDRRYSGMLDAFVRIWRDEGIRGLWRGTSMGLVGCVSGAIQWTTYEQLKLLVSDRRRRQRGESTEGGAEELSNLEYTAVAAAAKEVSVLSTYPTQVVRSRLQYDEKAYAGVRDCISKTWAQGGIRTFYKGVVPTAIRVLPSTAVTFLLYENIAQALKGTELAERGLAGFLGS